jgi:hypothetical protein
LTPAPLTGRTTEGAPLGRAQRALEVRAERNSQGTLSTITMRPEREGHKASREPKGRGALGLELPLAAESVDLGFLLEEVKEGRDVGVVDIAMGHAHLGPLVPQHRVHGLHGRTDQLAKQ